VLGWCAATLTSVALASVAMLPVLRTAAPDESALVSVEQLRDGGSAEPTTLPAVPPGPSVSASRSAEPSVAPTPARSPTTTAAPPSRTPAPATTTMETTTEDGWTVTTDGDGKRSYVRSFRVDGGQTVIRMTDGKVRLVTATPSDGYAVSTVQNSPDNLAVYFNEVNHSFIIHAVWWDDRPFAEVSEIGG
jgi:hypothetical protein